MTVIMLGCGDWNLILNWKATGAPQFVEFHFLEKLNCTQRTPENQILIDQIPIRRISISHSVAFQMIEFQFVVNLIPIIPNNKFGFCHRHNFDWWWYDDEDADDIVMKQFHLAPYKEPYSLIMRRRMNYDQ